MDDWKQELIKALAGTKSWVILGVGNEIMGDDAAGDLIAQQLEILQKPDSQIQIVVYRAGTTPENFTGPIERMRPDLVLMVDAADMGQPVGKVAWLQPEQMGSMMHGTHTMPLSFLADYIRRTSGAKVAALGIQAGRITMDSGLSPEVAYACSQIVESIKQAVAERDG